MQDGAPVIAHQFDRTDRPGAVQLVPQAKFVPEPVQAGGCRRLVVRENCENRPAGSVSVVELAAKVGALAVLPHGLEVRVALGGDTRN